MPLLASELKNKFFYTLRAFTEETVALEWEEYLKTHDSNDDFGFVTYICSKHVDIRTAIHPMGYRF